MSISPTHPTLIAIADARLKTSQPIIYRLYDEAGDLLYIGTTRRWLVDRLTAHRNAKPWWSEVSHVTIEPQRTPWGALDVERAAIRDERPRYNKRSAVSA